MNKKYITGLLVLAFSMLIINCNPKNPPVNIPPPPKQSETVVPHLHKVETGVDSSIEQNSKMDEKIKQQKTNVKEQQLTIEETIAYSEKLRERIKSNQAIYEIEVLNILNGLKKIQTRNLFLEKQIDEMDLIISNQSTILAKTKKDVEITYKKLIDKENETTELRSQNQFLSENLKIKSVEVEKLKENLNKEKEKTANAKVYKTWVIWIIVGIVVWIILRNLLMIYFPATKFRI